MTVGELLTQITRFVFIVLSVLTILDYLRHRDRIRRDIALTFVCVAAPVIIATVRSALALPSDWLAGVGAAVLLAQPYLLLRLVGYFRPVPPLLSRFSEISLIASWAAVLLLGTPLPAPVTLAMVAYFVIVDGYAVFAFIQGAFSTAGVTRNRLRFAALGSAALVLVLFLAGIRVAIPSLTPVIFPLSQFVALISGPAYYLGFAPPRWLRQAWQNAELREYLRTIHKPGHQEIQEIVDRLYLAVSRAMGTFKVAIAIWDQDSQTLVWQQAQGSPALSLEDFYQSSIVRQAWQEQTPLAVYKTRKLAAEDQRLMERLQAETVLIVPIATVERTLGILMAFLDYGSLFVHEDLSLMSIFAQQKAILMENSVMVQELHEHNEELEKKVAERTAALQRSNEELRRYAYVASHDLQEPLRMVTSYLELVENRYADKLDDEGREFIAFAVDGALRMKNLINDLLVYSRVETRARNFTLVDLEKVLSDTRKFLEVTISETGATLTSDPLPQIVADEQLMFQLFQNLIGNALKYRGDRKPEVHISADCKDRMWTFAVRDNGIGIESQYLERIFVIFQRLHTREEYPGTGIGLAVCKKAVELHGGHIWAESEVGHGTTFYFTIPARQQLLVHAAEA